MDFEGVVAEAYTIRSRSVVFKIIFLTINLWKRFVSGSIVLREVKAAG